MRGEADVFLYLIELEAVDDRERVFLALDGSVLETLVKPVGVDRGGRSAERFERIVEHLARGNANLHPLQVGDGADWMRRACDVTEAVLETAFGQRIDALGHRL